MDLLAAIQSRNAKVAVIGLGYVGLPLALRIANCRFFVVGLDNDKGRVTSLMEGHSPILEVSDKEIALSIETGRFRATTDAEVLRECNVILICVPTPLEQGSPNMDYIRQAADSVSRYLLPEQLIVLESTTYPGTTDEFLRGILETSGLKAGEDFYLGFSPERIDPGNKQYGISNVPKVIGGFDPRSAELMEAFYRNFVNTIVRVSSARSAEMTKLLENTYRHVNIALANEMAILCQDLGINIWEVIEAARTKPFGFQAFYPGPGWGGHCIPVDPALLSWRVKQMGSTARFVELAREFNERMPRYIVQRVTEILNESNRSLKGSSVIVLGVAYKADVNDVRESPALEIIERLTLGGAHVSFHDPHVSCVALRTGKMEAIDLCPETLQRADLVLMHTAHSVYEPEWIAQHSRLIFDTRNFLNGVEGPIVVL